MLSTWALGSVSAAFPYLTTQIDFRGNGGWAGSQASSCTLFQYLHKTRYPLEGLPANIDRCLIDFVCLSCFVVETREADYLRP